MRSKTILAVVLIAGFLALVGVASAGMHSSAISDHMADDHTDSDHHSEQMADGHHAEHAGNHAHHAEHIGDHAENMTQEDCREDMR